MVAKNRPSGKFTFWAKYTKKVPECSTESLLLSRGSEWRRAKNLEGARSAWAPGRQRSSPGVQDNRDDGQGTNPFSNAQRRSAGLKSRARKEKRNRVPLPHAATGDHSGEHHPRLAGSGPRLTGALSCGMLVKVFGKLPAEATFHFSPGRNISTFQCQSLSCWPLV